MSNFGMFGCTLLGFSWTSQVFERSRPYGDERIYVLHAPSKKNIHFTKRAFELPRVIVVLPHSNRATKRL